MRRLVAARLGLLYVADCKNQRVETAGAFAQSHVR
jgi:hypothetical protein